MEHVEGYKRTLRNIILEQTTKYLIEAKTSKVRGKECGTVDCRREVANSNVIALGAPRSFREALGCGGVLPPMKVEAALVAH